MLTKSYYQDFINNCINDKTTNITDCFLGTYNYIDYLLREVLKNSLLSFSTPRASFLYVIEVEGLGIEDGDRRSPLRIVGSHVFNVHYKIYNKNYEVSEIDYHHALFIFQILYNHFSDERVTLLNNEQIEKILSYSIKQNTSAYITKLDCYIKSVQESKTKYNFPLYEIVVTDNFGDEIKIYLWEESDTPPFHRKFSDLVKYFELGIKVRFFNLSLSEKGYYYQNKNTTIVLDPDFLRDIASVSECFILGGVVIPEIAFLRIIRPFDFSFSIIKGGFINNLLDKLIESPLQLPEAKLFCKDFYKTYLQYNFLKICCFTEKELLAILNDVLDNHLPNLLKVVELYSSYKIHTEPSFMSEKYGLTGRLDALVEENDHKTVFELKSGKVPKFNTWSSHYAQIMGYNMLLDSVYEGKRSGHSSILYSGASEKPLRNVSSSEIAFAQILMCRNCIVGMTYKCANGTLLLNELFQQLKTFNATPGFLLSDITSFVKTYNTLEDYEKSYLNTYTSFILKDLIYQKVGYVDTQGVIKYGYSSLWNLSYQEKIKNRSILANLKLKSVDGRFFHFELSDDSDIGGFREGDLLLVYPVQNPLKVPFFKAILKSTNSVPVAAISDRHRTDGETPPPVAAISDRHRTNGVPPLNVAIGDRRYDDAPPLNVAIGDRRYDDAPPLKICTVVFRNEALTENDLIQYEYFHAEKDIFESSTYGNIASLASFFTSEKTKREVFFGIKKPRLTPPHTDINDITDTYKRVLQKASIFKDYLLIQGPPGTGKTSKYLISIVKQHLKEHITPIVILAHTNRAVDEICTKLSENELNYMLLGSRHTYTSPEITFNNVESDTPIYKLIPSLNENRIYVSTVINFHFDIFFLKKLIVTDLLIIDEASQLLEHQLIGIIGYFNKFILIGDHYQLPAVSLKSTDSTPDILKNVIGINSLNESLFERLFRRCEQQGWRDSFEILPEHYRMHSDIAKLINPFYNNKLIASNERQHLPSPYTSQRIQFINTTEKQHSRYNTEEALKIKEIIIKIYADYKEDFNNNTVGVICAWRLQVNLVISTLSDLPYANLITVDTVEKFQGSERDIIIYTTALSSTELLKNIQSLTADEKVDRKLNVAISRAREQFILLGNKDILNQTVHYGRIINNI